MSRESAVARAERYFASGDLKRDLTRRIAMPTESQNPARAPVLVEYLEMEMKPALEKLGFKIQVLHEGRWPFLFAERKEDKSAPTVFGYGHGDVIRGLDNDWEEGLSPWRLTERGDRWYGRGVADSLCLAPAPARRGLLDSVRLEGQRETNSRAGALRDIFAVCFSAELLGESRHEGQAEPALTRLRHAAAVVLDHEVRLTPIGIGRELHPDGSAGFVKRVLEAVRHQLVDDQPGGYGSVQREQKACADIDLNHQTLALRIDIRAECAEIIAEIDLAGILADRELIMRERDRVHAVHDAGKLLPRLGALGSTALKREKGHDGLQVVLRAVLQFAQQDIGALLIALVLRRCVLRLALRLVSKQAEAENVRDRREERDIVFVKCARRPEHRLRARPKCGYRP